MVIRTATDQDVAELTLIENIQREDLNPIEEAEAYEKLAERFGLTHEQIAKRTGKNRSVITNQLRLLRLSEKAKEALVSGAITVGHARALLAASSLEQMDSLLGEVLKKDLTVRGTEALVKKKNRSTRLLPEFTSGESGRGYFHQGTYRTDCREVLNQSKDKPQQEKRENRNRILFSRRA